MDVTADLLITTLALLASSIILADTTAVSPWEKMPAHPIHTDHSTFFQAPFADAQHARAVTANRALS